MTIWFSTNIPEMRAISTFNRVSTDIGEIQHRITTGQRINSGKDDPGGLIIREGLRADIKNINATQSGMTQAEILMDTAASGMTQLIEIINGSPTDPSSGGLLKMLDDPLVSLTAKASQVADFIKLYDAVTNKTTYGKDGSTGLPQKLLADAPTKTYQLGDGTGTLTVAIPSLASATVGGNITAPTSFADEAAVTTYKGKVETALTTITTALGNLGMKQQIAATNQRLLDSRLTSVTAAEGRISNADVAVESSRMARAELLAQNAMSSIMYTRNYAAFAVSSLFG
jgi:flagellin